MQNYLLPTLQNYFEEIVGIKAKINITNTFLTNYKKKMQEDNPQNRELMGGILSYRDLSQLEKGNNLYSPDYSYTLEVDRLDEEIEEVISQHSCLCVSQAYEIFESYLIDIVTEFLFNNQHKLIELKQIKANLILLKGTIREIVKNNQKRNNKGIISLIRKLSPHFALHETKNIHTVNICHWFDLVSMVRHTLVHNRRLISNRLLEYLEKQKANDMFEKHFKRRKIGKNVHIYLEALDATEIIHWLNSFAHFIFKSLSIDNKLPLNVPEFIPVPWGLGTNRTRTI